MKAFKESVKKALTNSTDYLMILQVAGNPSVLKAERGVSWCILRGDKKTEKFKAILQNLSCMTLSLTVPPKL